MGVVVTAISVGKMSRLGVVALLALGSAGCGWLGERIPYHKPDTSMDFGEDEDPDEWYWWDVLEIFEPEIRTGLCIPGQSASLFFVRIADDLDNSTLTGDCGGGNPGADIDAIVLVRPDGTEFYADTVEEDSDVAGEVCETNSKDDLMAVVGQPDGCAKDLGCGCGDHGYPTNPDCDCAGGDEKWTGYYSLNGSAIIVSFEQGAEILCGDQVVVYEMYNPEVAGSEETYEVAYGDEMGNFICQTDYSTGTGIIDVSWEW
jgi:hypothetical protein